MLSPVLMDDFVSSDIRVLRTRMEEIAHDVASVNAERTDTEARWPAETIQAISDAGLMGLNVPQRLGGHEQGLLALAILTETLGQACSSAAMCFGMHCVGSAVLAAKSSDYHDARFLAPIAAGQHLTTLALSESGSGAHFYFPQTELTRDEHGYEINGAKHFVTNATHADSFVVSTKASSHVHTGEFSVVAVETGAEGIEFGGPWAGLGMRGNDARTVRFHGVRVAERNLLGEEGDEIWYAFEIVAPYFLIAMSGAYLGVAQAALDAALQHIKTRTYAFAGEPPRNNAVIQTRIADLWAEVEKTRYLLYNAARGGDAGDRSALSGILMSKADVARTCVHVANEAMTLCGGMAYRENGQIGRLLRDARASHVMAPTTDLLRQWAGRVLLGMPLL